jgi:hypothetical protein
MRRLALAIIVVVACITAFYGLCSVFYRGTWYPTGQQIARRDSGISSKISQGSYPIKIEHGLPFPCLSHNQPMTCFSKVVVTTDALGFHIIANLARVAVPFATLIGKERLVYVQGTVTVQTESDKVSGTVTLAYDKPGAKNQPGFSAQLPTDDTIYLQSDGPSDGTFAVTVGEHKHNGTFALDSHNVSLQNLDKFCVVPLWIDLSSSIRFTVPSVTNPGTDASINMQSEISSSIAIQECSTFMKGLQNPLLVNSWEKIWTAFQEADVPITIGNSDGDYFVVSATLNVNGDGDQLQQVGADAAVVQSEVRPDRQNGIVGKATVQSFAGKSDAATAYVLGIRGEQYWLDMPDDVLISMELQNYHNMVTFVGCEFTLGPFNLHLCANQPWP